MWRMGLYDQLKKAFQDIVAPEIQALRGEILRVEGRLDVAQAIEWWRAKSRSRAKRRRVLAPVIRFDDEASGSATVVEVRAEDEPGLVYRIAATLAALGLTISFAKIATEKTQALDVFYVTDTEGLKLSAHRLAVEAALLAALAPPPRQAIS